MKTSISIDGELLAQAVMISSAKTNEEAVELALKEFIKIKQRKRMDQLRGTFNWG